MFLSIQVQFTDPHTNLKRHDMLNQQDSQSSSSREDNNPNINIDFKGNSECLKLSKDQTYHFSGT